MANRRDLISEYERERLKNIEELQGEFGYLFENVKSSASNLASVCKSGNNINSTFNNLKKRSHSDLDTTTPSTKIIRRSSRIRTEKSKSTNYNEQSDDDDENQKNVRRGSFRIKFPWFKNKKNELMDEAYYNNLGDSDFVDSDEDYIDDNIRSSRKKGRSRKNVRTPRLAVSQVTPEILNNITYSSSGKTYSSDGTTCHQCRQKTADQKSYCRYKKCSGVRGMFCGFCLGNRYGEDVAEVLLNPKWACPPCRGYCNCSICRRKNGRIPTGQLVGKATAEGYKSVKDLLDSLEGKNPENYISSDSDIEENDDRQGYISDEKCKQNDNNVVTDKHTKTEQLNDETVNAKTENKIVDVQLETYKNMKDKSDDDTSYEDENDRELINNENFKQLFLSTSRVH